MKCRVCNSVQCDELLDFGPQPISHHFVDATHVETSYPLKLGQCRHCGTVQSLTPVPPHGLVSHFSWIAYNEPEAHLDALVDRLRALPGITPGSRIGGLSYKEDSTLRRFANFGFGNTWRVDSEADLGLSARQIGMEGIQERINRKTASVIARKYGSSDILIARHVLEHTHDTSEFIAALRSMVHPTGYIAFEVPDSARAFDFLDYTTVWEDHTLYFVESTFLGSLSHHGLEIVRFERYRAAYENCLVAITTPCTSLTPVGADPTTIAVALRQAQRFAQGLEIRQRELRDFLLQRRAHGKIALLGAGHLAVAFINLMQVADLIDFVVDDDPNKDGKQMPGSRLPVFKSHALVEQGVKFCLTSVSAESETKVIQRNRAFLDAGGVFASIFPIIVGELVHPLVGVNRAA